MEYNELEKTISFIVIIDDNGETYVNDFTRVNNLEIIFDSVSYLFGNSYDDKLDRGIEYDIILNSTIVGDGNNIKLENSNENELIYIFHIDKLGILEDLDSSSVIELYINIDDEELALSILFD